MTAQLKRLIHLGCRELGLDADTRHDLQLRVVGKASLSDMSEDELGRVVDALKEQGFTPSGPVRRRPKAPRADLRLIHVLWAKLGQAGELNDPTRKGLNAFVSKRFGAAWGFVPADIDQLREADKIDAILQALMQWGRRAGIDFDWSRIGK